jgi:eukaryotic-like serine/threonine-protein kinase
VPPPPSGDDGRMCCVCHRQYPRPTDHFTEVERCPEDGGVLVYVRDYLDADEDTMLGRTIAGRYTILARLGAGSMGTVYRARQEAIGRNVAVKILRYDRALDDRAKARFEREAKANSALVSPHTVTVFDFGVAEDGSLYLAMEMLVGEPLGARLRRQGRLPLGEAIRITRDSLASLAEAHSLGIIHRDIKPDNLFLARTPSRDGTGVVELCKVLDFGIAKIASPERIGMDVLETQAGTVFGTPRYMSPEQAQGRRLDARSDLYSLGVILFQMVVGRPPFEDEDAVVVMARHIKTPPPMLADIAPDLRIPGALEDVMYRVLSKQPDERPSSADEFLQELDIAMQGADQSGERRVSIQAVDRAIPLVPSQRPFPVTGAAIFGGLALLALGVGVFVRRSPPQPYAVNGSQQGLGSSFGTPTQPASSVADPAASALPTGSADAAPSASGATVSLESLPPAEGEGKKKKSGRTLAPPRTPSTATTAGKYPKFD